MHNSIFSDPIQNREDISNLENYCSKTRLDSRQVFRFPPDIEKAYRTFFFKADKKKNIAFIIIGCFFYNIFALMDPLMIRDIYMSAWKLRFFLVTPLAAAGVFVILKTDKPYIMDSVIAALLFSGAVSIFIMLYLSHTFLSTQYHSGIYVLTIAGILIFKLSLFFKIFFSAGLLAAHLIFFAADDSFLLQSEINITAVFISLSFVSLIAAAEKESAQRKSFIYSLSQEIAKLNLEKKNRLLKKLSNKDALTNLANRRFLTAHLERLVNHIQGGIFPISVLYIDIDDFKKFNDNYGHNAGDQCIIKVSDVLRSFAKRKFDLASRCGGEEFIVVLPFTSVHDAEKIAERIKNKVADLKIPHAFSVEPFVTISIGLSSIENSEKDIDTVLGQADKALYNAKNTGKNRVSVFL